MNFFTLLLLLSRPAGAQCALPQGPQALVACVRANDPEVKASEARLAWAESLVGPAGRRPNPEVDAKASWGEGASKTELDLVQTLETGGKRGARVEFARAGREGAAAALDGARADAALRAVAALTRLRQLRSEQALIAEALETFSRIGEQLSSRPRLAPEQEASKAVFELAAADYELKKAALSAEEKGLRLALEASAGTRLPEDVGTWPPYHARWPAVGEGGAAGDPEVRRARAEQRAAHAERGAALAAAWPDLRIGPAYERERDAGGGRRMLGVNLGLPLPLWNTGAAGIASARRGAVSAALAAEAVEAKVRAERESERVRYDSAVAALKLAGDRNDVHAKHERVEDFFERGLISSSLVIEAHRQIFDFTRDLHEQESAAVRALWRIAAIDGRLPGEAL